MRFAIIFALFVLPALAISGCKGHTNALHITSVNPDAHIDVTASFGDKEYALSVDRSAVPLYVAYYEPIETGDVGKDFHATLSNGAFTVDVPGKGSVHYNVEAARER
jgi:hypothetical protein